MNDPRGRWSSSGRVLPASAEVAYDQWLDADALADFITPGPARSGRVNVDPRVGGAFRIEMIDSQGVVQIAGRYLELERPRRLRFSWQSSLGGGFDSVVTVTFEPHGETETLMTIEHAQLPPAWRDDHERGWTVIAAQTRDWIRRGAVARPAD
jgi:uncharacterized protein YndB with AHSA1/START domain